MSLNFALGWNRGSLSVMGLWPEDHEHHEGNRFFTHYRFLVPLTLLTFLLFIPQFINLFIVYENLDLVTEILSTANIPVFATIVKIIVVRRNRQALKAITRSFVQDWLSSKNKAETETMMENARTARKISIGCNLLVQGTLIFFISQRIIAIVQAEISDSDRTFVYQSYFPAFFKTTPYYQLVCLGQVAAAFCLSTCYTGIDCFICMLVLHACGQFENLQRILLQGINSPKNWNDYQKFRMNLREIVERHEHLNWFGRTVENSFNFCLLIQMLSCTVHMCFQGFLAFRALSISKNFPIEELLFLLSFVACIMILIYIYCYVGELLLVASSGMKNAVFDSDWYNLTPRNIKLLIFFILRSTRPLQLTAGKFSVFSLQTFSTILKTSVGYLSVLVTVMEGTKEEKA